MNVPPRRMRRAELSKFVSEWSANNLIQKAVYERSNDDLMPSKRFALEVFKRYYETHTNEGEGCDVIWGKQHKVRRGDPTQIANALEKWASTHHARFLFKVERTVLLKKIGPKGYQWGIFYASNNTTLPLKKRTRGGWVQVNNKKDLAEALKNIKGANMWGELAKIFKNSSWSLASHPFLEYKIKCLEILGDRFGTFTTLPKSWPATSLYNPLEPDRKCFWRCVLFHMKKKGKKALATLFAQFNEPSKRYRGVTIKKIREVEETLKISIHIYTLNGVVTELYKSQFDFEPCYLARHKDHFAYIKDLQKFAGLYKCQRCNKVFPTCKKRNRHTKRCSLQAVWCYPRIKIVEEETVIPTYTYHNPRRSLRRTFGRYPSFICWDFEAMLPRLQETNTKLQYISEHHPGSCSMSFRLNGVFQKTTLVRGQEEESVFLGLCLEQLLKYHAIIVKWVFEDKAGLLAKYRAEMSVSDKKESAKSEYRYKQLIDWICEVPVIAFNAKYDLNLFKATLRQLNLNVHEHIRKILRPPRVTTHVKKISSYKQQDRRAGRSLENYITPSYIDSLIKGQTRLMHGFRCLYCHQPMENFTLERWDNNLAHVKSNVGCVCLHCNVSKLPNFRRRINQFTKKHTALDEQLEDICHYMLFRKSEVLALKSANAIRCVFSKCFRFIDIRSFLPPCNLRQFLSAWNCKLEKGFFPYECWRHIDDLKRTTPPTRDEFYSWLRTDNEVTEKIYEELMTTWKEKGFRNWRDFLVWYNELDVEPLTFACEKLSKFYWDKGVDLLKNFVSISSYALWAAMKSAMKHPKTKLFYPIREADLHTKFAHPCGGYSAPFAIRHVKCGTTLLHGKQLAQTLLGLDATSLYPHTLRQRLPQGDYTRTTPTIAEITQKLLDGWFGFVDCTVRVTEPEWEAKYRRVVFAPLFKHCTWTHSADNLSPKMWELLQKHGKPKTVSKLVNSLFATDMMFSTSLVWLLKHGCSITHCTEAVEFGSGYPFRDFIEQLANERRVGDYTVDGEKPWKVLGDTAKLTGSSIHGKLGERFDRYRKTLFRNTQQMQMDLERDDFCERFQLGPDSWEVKRLKRKILWDRPNYLASAVYSLSKTHMLSFVYDFLEPTLHPDKWQLISGDTDSLYMALAGPDLESCVLNQDLWDELKPKWLPTKSEKVYCTMNHDGHTFDLTERQWYHREGGLFKEEWKSIEPDAEAFAVNPKTYLYTGGPITKSKLGKLGAKLGLKGLVESRLVNTRDLEEIKKIFHDIVYAKTPEFRETNRGFRLHRREDHHRLCTYSQEKVCMSFLVDKLLVNDDMVTCRLTNL